MNISFRLNSELSALNTLFAQLQIVASTWSISKKTLAEINLMLDELLTNTIKYGGCGKDQPIDITLTKTGTKLTIRVIDSGEPFDPTHCKSPDISLPLEQRRCGGLGILLVRQFCDCWSYVRADKKNVLTLQKTLPQEPRRLPCACTTNHEDDHN